MLLRGTQGVCKTKGGLQPFIQAKTGAEGCLPLISFGYADSLKDLDNVNLCELLRLGDLLESLVYQRKGVLVFLCDCIERSVIHTEVEFPSWFLCKEY
jgi:hypothetical protein